MTSIPSNTQAMPRLLTTEQACEYLWNKKGRTMSARLYRAVADQRITSKRLSGRHWFPLTSLQKFAGETED